MKPTGEIPFGTFIEFTWHSAGPEPEEIWDSRCDSWDDDRVELIGVAGEDLASSDVIWIDAAWNASNYIND